MRDEFPRPQAQRKNWQSLNGKYLFAFIEEFDNRYFDKTNYNLTIEVPFTFESELSGLKDTTFHEKIVYYKEFKVLNFPHTILHFEAVDYESYIYLNKELIGHNIGGETPIDIDVSDKLKENNTLVIYVIDSPTNQSQPRGKQYWKEKSAEIFYTRTSGIWQSVWLEYLPDVYISNLKLTPLYDLGLIQIEFNLNELVDYEIIINDKVYKSKAKSLVVIEKIKVLNNKNDYQKYSWSPEQPYLFNLIIKAKDDTLTSYFGMRKISYNADSVLLNNKPYFLKMLLDQGYYEDGILTPSDISVLKNDIIMMKEMGFNGARKHQKIEDFYYYYYADTLGFLVWSENASSYLFNDESKTAQINDWKRLIKRNYNHPCIMAWVPLNESWGVPLIAKDKEQQLHSLNLVNIIKELDSTRLVVSNDGWEQTKGDLCCFHNYQHGRLDEIEKRKKFAFDLKSKENILKSTTANKTIYAEGYQYNNVPIILSEFGGISFTSKEGWGYTSVNSEQGLLDEYKRIIDVIELSTGLAGYVYTQFSDVEQEINGLVTYQRKYKVDPKKIKEINDLV
ncbi:MAG: glycoside hydrolase family 2 [Bacillales bacterium]|jgi:beta-galactosidase/beta-glucuronidase|nr:glycoside hydrolase family 2 [Bacillales bacterium]